MVLFILLAALPFLDRRPERRASRRRWVIATVLILGVGWVVLTVMVALAAPAAHLG